MRLDPKIRKDIILEAAAQVIRRDGYQNMTLPAVADLASMTSPLVFHYFKDIDDLRDQVMVRAIETKDLKIIAQGLSLGLKIAQAAPAKLKRQAIQSLL